jgi:hypothetical protein
MPGSMLKKLFGFFEPFDPEGSGYDYRTAVASGIGPDETGHWSSRDPKTGVLLKGRQHETWDLLEEGEREAGYEIYQGDDGRYYSRPKGATAAPANSQAQSISPMGKEIAMPYDAFNPDPMEYYRRRAKQQRVGLQPEDEAARIEAYRQRAIDTGTAGPWGRLTPQQPQVGLQQQPQATQYSQDVGVGTGPAFQPVPATGLSPELDQIANMYRPIQTWQPPVEGDPYLNPPIQQGAVPDWVDTSGTDYWSTPEGSARLQASLNSDFRNQDPPLPEEIHRRFYPQPSNEQLTQDWWNAQQMATLNQVEARGDVLPSTQEAAAPSIAAGVQDYLGSPQAAQTADSIASLQNQRQHNAAQLQRMGFRQTEDGTWTDQPRDTEERLGMWQAGMDDGYISTPAFQRQLARDPRMGEAAIAQTRAKKEKLSARKKAKLARDLDAQAEKSTRAMEEARAKREAIDAERAKVGLGSPMSSWEAAVDRARSDPDPTRLERLLQHREDVAAMRDRTAIKDPKIRAEMVRQRANGITPDPTRAAFDIAVRNKKTPTIGEWVGVGLPANQHPDTIQTYYDAQMRQSAMESYGNYVTGWQASMQGIPPEEREPMMGLNEWMGLMGMSPAGGENATKPAPKNKAEKKSIKPKPLIQPNVAPAAAGLLPITVPQPGFTVPRNRFIPSMGSFQGA